LTQSDSIVRCYFRPRRSMNFANAIPHFPEAKAQLKLSVPVDA
jgi:hypothetical protein